MHLLAQFHRHLEPNPKSTHGRETQRRREKSELEGFIGLSGTHRSGVRVHAGRTRPRASLGLLVTSRAADLSWNFAATLSHFLGLAIQGPTLRPSLFSIHQQVVASTNLRLCSCDASVLLNLNIVSENASSTASTFSLLCLAFLLDGGLRGAQQRHDNTRLGVDAHRRDQHLAAALHHVRA